MPATRPTLVEIGLKLRAESEDTGGRIAHRIPEAGLNHTAQMLKKQPAMTRSRHVMTVSS